MIIWGTTGREIEQERGYFHCPECGREERYRLLRLSTYFTLYFIPLFETTHHGDIVRCGRCRGVFVPEVLDREPPGPRPGDVRRAVRAELEHGTSIEKARAELAKAGLTRREVDRLIDRVAGEPLVCCLPCSLTFVDGVDRCSECGRDL